MTPSSQPIIFITTDTQGREMVSAYGPAHWHRTSGDQLADKSLESDNGTLNLPQTPNIDKLASRGTLFRNCITTAPLCTPARSTWYTGLPPNRNGSVCNDTSPSRNIPMLGELLQRAGYNTCHVGKWHLDGSGYAGSGHGHGGFSDKNWYDLQNFYREVGSSNSNRFSGWMLGLEDINYCFAHRVVNRAIDILQNRDETNPLFLAVELDEPHGPYICPPEFQGRYEQELLPRPNSFLKPPVNKPQLQHEYSSWLARSRQSAGLGKSDEYPTYYHKYYDCNTYADYEIGRLITAINEYCPEALIIYTSDHGDHLGAFGLCAKGPTMYDHTVAVPLIISSPGLAANVQNNSLVSSIDVWATIMDAANLSVPEGKNKAGSKENEDFPRAAGYTGSSLLPLLRGEKDESHHRQEAFIEYNRFGRQGDRTNGFYPIRCIRTVEWKLSINLFDTDELYDLHADPGEEENLIDAEGHASVRNELHDTLLAHLKETNDIFYSPAWEQRSWRNKKPTPFQGYFTTGYNETWPSGSFSKW